MPTGVVTISSFTLNPTSDISTGSTIYLRGWYTRSFVAGDGATPVEGGNGQTGFYYNIACSLNGSGLVVVPAFDVWATTLSNPTANFLAQLYVDGAPGQMVMPQTPQGSGWQVPTLYGATITFAQLALYNRAKRLLYPDNQYLTRDQTITLIEQLAGNFDFMAVGINGIGSASFPPVVASQPVVLMANDPRVGDWFNIEAYFASTVATAAQNTTFITAAIAAATSAGGGIYVPLGTFPLNTLSITVPVMFAPGASILAPASAQVLTITKSIDADPSQHFGGAGTVVFTGNNVQKDYWVVWWGATGNGVADDTTAINAAGVAVGTRRGSTLHFTPGAVYSTTGVTFDHLAWITFMGSDSETIIAVTSSAPRFRYTGTAGGTLIRMNNLYGCTFRGFYLGDDGAHEPNILIDMDMTVGGDPTISSQNTIEYNIFDGNTRAGLICLKIDNAQGVNNEQHNIHGNFFVGGQQAFPNQTGIGIYLGHVNVKQVLTTRNAFTGLVKFVSCASGSFRSAYNRGGSTMVMYDGTVSDAIVIENDDTESLCQVVSLVGGAFGSPITITGGRYADLRGGQAVSATTNDSPAISGGNLIISGNIFSAQDEFTSDFIVDSSAGQTPLGWGINDVLNFNSGSFPINPSVLYAGFATFASVRRFGGAASTGQGGELIGGNAAQQNSFRGLMSTPMARALIGVQQDTGNVGAGLTVSAQNSVTIGESGQMEIGGLARPQRPNVTVEGTPGAVTYIFAIITRDALGNRTMPSILNQDAVTANATLSGSNFLHVTWPKVPGAADYLLLQFQSSAWRVVATVALSGTNEEEYDVVANPAGAFTYVIPTFNETVANKFRGATVMPVERTFTSLDATPSVVGSSDFVTANAGATSITTFDGGIIGQIIRVRVADANTTFVNGATLANRSGANIVATNGLIYTYILRGTVWYQL